MPLITLLLWTHALFIARFLFTVPWLFIGLLLHCGLLLFPVFPVTLLCVDCYCMDSCSHLVGWYLLYCYLLLLCIDCIVYCTLAHVAVVGLIRLYPLCIYPVGVIDCIVLGEPCVPTRCPLWVGMCWLWLCCVIVHLIVVVFLTIIVFLVWPCAVVPNCCVVVLYVVLYSLLFLQLYCGFLYLDYSYLFSYCVLDVGYCLYLPVVFTFTLFGYAFVVTLWIMLPVTDLLLQRLIVPIVLLLYGVLLWSALYLIWLVIYCTLRCYLDYYSCYCVLLPIYCGLDLDYCIGWHLVGYLFIVYITLFTLLLTHLLPYLPLLFVL